MENVLFRKLVIFKIYRIIGWLFDLEVLVVKSSCWF